MDPGSHEIDEAPGRRGGFRRWLPLLVLAAAIAAFFASGLRRYLTWESFRDHHQWLLDEVASAGVLAPLIFTLAYTAMAAMSVPGAVILTLAGGFLFGT